MFSYDNCKKQGWHSVSFNYTPVTHVNVSFVIIDSLTVFLCPLSHQRLLVCKHWCDYCTVIPIVYLRIIYAPGIVWPIINEGLNLVWILNSITTGKMKKHSRAYIPYMSYHEIHRVEAVGRKTSNYIIGPISFVNMGKFLQFRKKKKWYFVNNCLVKVRIWKSFFFTHVTRRPMDYSYSPWYTVGLITVIFCRTP